MHPELFVDFGTKWIVCLVTSLYYLLSWAYQAAVTYGSNYQKTQQPVWSCSHAWEGHPSTSSSSAPYRHLSWTSSGLLLETSPRKPKKHQICFNNKLPLADLWRCAICRGHSGMTQRSQPTAMTTMTTPYLLTCFLIYFLKNTPIPFSGQRSSLCKRHSNLALVFLRLFCVAVYVIMDAYLVLLCLIYFSVLSHEIGCEERLRNDLFCVGWDVKL